MDAYFIYNKSKLVDYEYFLGCFSFIFQRKKRKLYYLYSLTLIEKECSHGLIYQFDKRHNFGCYVLMISRGNHRLVVMTQNPEQFKFRVLNEFLILNIHQIKSNDK